MAADSRVGFLIGDRWRGGRRFWALLLLPAMADAQSTFAERGGIVAIEAEHATDNVGAWEEVEGRNATAVQRGTTHDTRLRRGTGENPFSAALASEVELPRGTMLPWGFAGPQAIVGWTLGHDARKATVFGYERGAAMPGGAAAGRRVLVPALSEGAPDALGRVFDAAVRWGASERGNGPVLMATNQVELVDEERLALRRFESLGFTIRTKPAADLHAKDVADCALVFIPAPVRVEKIGTKLNAVSVPVVTSKSHIAQLLGMVPPARESRPGDNAMLIRSGRWEEHLRYAIHFSQPGRYRVWLLGQSGGDGGSDEPKIFFEESPDVKSERFFEMKLSPAPAWAGAATARRAENRKTPVDAMVEVSRVGWHNLYIAKGAEPELHGETPPETRRYPNWRLDKIVLARDAAWQPAGDGPAETRAGPDAPALPRDFAARREWRPRQVWKVRGGGVVLEAEDLEHHAHWALMQEPKGFSGRGYLEWRGPQRSKSIEELGGNDDHLHVRQGSPEEWLILRFDVAQRGLYRIDVRNHHRLRDGDNDVWFARVGQRGTADAPIKRLVDSHRDGTGFTWLDGTPPVLELEAGLHEFYIAGRSVGFGVDRIALYRADDAAARARWLDPMTQAVAPRYPLAAVHDFESIHEPSFAPYYRDLRGADPARHALAIDAKHHQAKFAAARTVFNGPAGRYDFTLFTLTENDGESTYRARVGGRLVGEYQNPPGPDGGASSQTWRGVALKPGDAIQVESNTHSNGRIPEGTGFAWARGRWTQLRVVPAR